MARLGGGSGTWLASAGRFLRSTTAGGYSIVASGATLRVRATGSADDQPDALEFAPAEPFEGGNIKAVFVGSHGSICFVLDRDMVQLPVLVPHGVVLLK